MIPLDTVIIFRHDAGDPWSGISKFLEYALWTGSSWQLLRLDIGLGTCEAGPAFRSFIEARRAHRAGIDWPAPSLPDAAE